MNPIEDCDYINASWITSAEPSNTNLESDNHSNSSVSFFASQGPLPHTVTHHLQMIEEQRACVVVMLTKLDELVKSGNYVLFYLL